MTPTARRELRAYCEARQMDRAGVRLLSIDQRPKPPLTFADWSDLIVAVGCVAAFLAAVLL